MDLTRAMRAIAKASGGGRVTVELLETGEWFARVYPTRELSRDLVRAECRASGRAYPGNGSSDAWSEAFETRHMTQLNYGRGADPDAAVADLHIKVLAGTPKP